MFETKKKLIEWLDQMELTIGKAQWRTNADCNQEFAAYIYHEQMFANHIPNYKALLVSVPKLRVNNNEKSRMQKILGP